MGNPPLLFKSHKLMLIPQLPIPFGHIKVLIYLNEAFFRPDTAFESPPNQKWATCARGGGPKDGGWKQEIQGLAKSAVFTSLPQKSATKATKVTARRGLGIATQWTELSKLTSDAGRMNQMAITHGMRAPRRLLYANCVCAHICYIFIFEFSNWFKRLTVKTGYPWRMPTNYKIFRNYDTTACGKVPEDLSSSVSVWFLHLNSRQAARLCKRKCVWVECEEGKVHIKLEATQKSKHSKNLVRNVVVWSN